MSSVLHHAKSMRWNASGLSLKAVLGLSGGLLLLGACGPALPRPERSRPDDFALVRTFFEDLNHHDLPAARSRFAKDAVFTSEQGSVPALENLGHYFNPSACKYRIHRIYRKDPVIVVRMDRLLAGAGCASGDEYWFRVHQGRISAITFGQHDPIEYDYRLPEAR